jgi:hypothetical protein
MKTILFVLFSITCPNVTSQVIKTDTTILSPGSKVITRFEKNRTTEISIFGKDTFVFVDNTSYYKNFMDSLKNLPEYLKRDTISIKPDILFIHINIITSGCYACPVKTDVFFYFNSKLSKKRRGILLYSQLPRKIKKVKYLNKNVLDSLIETLNENMAFNIKGYGYPLFHTDQFYNMDITNVSIISEEKNKLIKSSFGVNSDYFGFGNKIFKYLEMIRFEKIDNGEDADYNAFLKKNKKYLIEKDYLKGMLWDKLK